MGKYAFSDIHGNYELFQTVMAEFHDDDEIYFLGDAADRGCGGLKIMQELLADKRVRYLKGNHEQLLCDAFLGTMDMHCSNYMQLWIARNGGTPTLTAIKETLDANEQKQLVNALLNLPVKAKLTHNGKKIVLCHAGYTPDNEPQCQFDYLWDRHHIYDQWPEQYEDTIIIHGHTPAPGNGEGTSLITWYADNHKVDIDCGVFSSHRISILNLETFEEKIIRQ